MSCVVKECMSHDKLVTSHVQMIHLVQRQGLTFYVYFALLSSSFMFVSIACEVDTID